MSTVGKIARGASTRIVTYPVRVLIIINSVLFPLLLGVIIFLILHYSKPVMDVITKAKSIEKLVEDNIHLGIQKVKELYDNKQNIVNYAKDSLVHMLQLYVPGLSSLDQLESIIITAFNNLIHNVEDSIFKFMEDNISIDDILQKIIDEIISSTDTIPDKTKIIDALNIIISYHYSIIDLFTHYELMT